MVLGGWYMSAYSAEFETYVEDKIKELLTNVESGDLSIDDIPDALRELADDLDQTIRSWQTYLSERTLPRMAKTLGQEGYEEYLRSGPKPGQTFDGRPMPSWDDLESTEAGKVTKARWEAAADRIVAVLSMGTIRDDKPPTLREREMMGNPGIEDFPPSERETVPTKDPWGPAQ
jgi:hypothetical protein